MHKNQKKVAIGFVLLFFVAPLLACITLFWIYPWGMSIYHENDAIEIERRTVEFDNLLDHGDFEEAYTYMSSSYRESKTYSDFLEDKDFFANNSWPGLDRDREIKVRGNKGWIFLGDARFLFWAGIEYKMINENEEWYFTGEYDWYVD